MSTGGVVDGWTATDVWCARQRDTPGCVFGRCEVRVDSGCRHDSVVRGLGNECAPSNKLSLEKSG